MSRFSAVSGNGGFTLIESLLSLTVFALILAIAYEGIVSTANSRKLIIEGIDRQQALRATHRTLGNAIYSNGPILGSADSLSIDMNHADSPWLNSIQSIMFKVDEAGQLVAYMDPAEGQVVLMRGLTRARFAYHDGEQKNNSWQSSMRPKWVELSWIENGNRRVWRFLAQI